MIVVGSTKLYRSDYITIAMYNFLSQFGICNGNCMPYLHAPVVPLALTVHSPP